MTTRTDSANRTIVFLTAQVFFAFALAVVFLPSAWAGENLSTLRAKAEAGDATAQYELGKRYYRGQGVQIDYAKALYWARLSASQGNSFGENLLGLLYDDGNGVAQNYAKALHWYRLAVRQGNAKAENNLGWLYADVDGVPQNISKAAYWLRLAAKHGYAPAKRNLRLIYFLSGEAPSSALSSSESQSIASQAAKQAVEEANAKTAEEIVGLKREIVRQKAALSPSAPHYSSMVDRPGFQLPKHRNWYAVVVGVEKYPKGIPPAEFSDRDAHAVKSNLIALGYPESHIRLLTNDQATDARIKATLKNWLPRNVPKEGRVLFYFAGHGGTDPTSKTAYLVPFDGDPEDLADTALSVGEIEKEIGKLPLSRGIIVADACFSGAGGRSVLPKGARPLTTVFRTPYPDHYKNLTVFGASEGNQISGDLPKEGHGIFTYYFLRGLEGQAKSGNAVTPRSLERYLTRTVPLAFRHHYDSGEQDPVVSGDMNGVLVKY